jgi:hypothetical protein
VESNLAWALGLAVEFFFQICKRLGWTTSSVRCNRKRHRLGNPPLDQQDEHLFLFGLVPSVPLHCPRKARVHHHVPAHPAHVHRAPRPRGPDARALDCSK